MGLARISGLTALIQRSRRANLSGHHLSPFSAQPLSLSPWLGDPIVTCRYTKADTQG